MWPITSGGVRERTRIYINIDLTVDAIDIREILLFDVEFEVRVKGNLNG